MIWNDDDIFTAAMAREVMDRGACKIALTYVDRTVGVVAAAEPGSALVYAADKITPERRKWCEARI